MKAAIILTLTLLLLVGLSSGGVCQVSRTGVIFLMIAPGARAGGMGECFAAISDDATATHWNPGGLGRYPLFPAFLEFKLETEGEIRQIAILKNNLPENNYLRYDIWALVGERLARWDGEKWVFGEDYEVREGESLEDIAERFTGTEDREARENMAKKIAEANTTIPFEEVEHLEKRILEKVPENYYYSKEIRMGLESLKRSWGGLTLDAKELQILKRSVEEYLADDSLLSLELDKLAFGVDKPVTTKMPEKIKIPFNLVLPGEINCLTSDYKDYLYVGTPRGLFRYDRRSWKAFTVESDTLPSNNVTAVVAGEKKSLWLGTDSGLARFDGSVWTTYTTAEGLPDNYITALEPHQNRTLWIGTKAGIAYFDGRGVRAYLDYPVRVGDDLEKIASRLLDSKHGAEIAAAAAMISDYNELADSDSLYPGRQIKIPYSVAFSGEVTSLALDKKDNLWVGTDSGVWSFHQDGWIRHGYKLYTAEGGESLLEVAQKFVGTKQPERAQRLANLIASYNKIDHNPLEAGEQLYIYANTAGARVDDLEGVGGEILVGTEYGTIKYDGKNWGRYYHQDLERTPTRSIIEKDGEIWFATEKKVAVLAHARKELTLMHTNLVPALASDVYYEYLSYVQNFRSIGTLGTSLTFVSYGSQQRTDEVGNYLGTFESFEYALGLSYGTSVTENLSMGLTTKYIYSHLAEAGAGAERGEGIATSFAIDGGLLYNPFKRLSLAAVVTNLGPNVAYIDADQSDPLPRNLVASGAYRLVDSPFNRLTLIAEFTKLLVDLNDRFDTEIQEVILHGGMEYWYGNFVALRAGYLYDQIGALQFATLGVGLQYSNYSFDFSYLPSSKENNRGNEMRFSMTGRF